MAFNLVNYYLTPSFELGGGVKGGISSSFQVPLLNDSLIYKYVVNAEYDSYLLIIEIN